MALNSLEDWLRRGLWMLVAIAPLPLASNRPLPAALLAFFAGLLLIGWALSVQIKKTVAVPPSMLWAPLVLFALTCAWIFIQWAPLSLGADPIWADASDILGLQLPGRISVNPDETLNGLMRLLTYGVVLWLSIQLNRNSEHARASLKLVPIIGVTYAAYGIVDFLLGNQWLLIYPKWAYRTFLTGTFVNPNSFATFLGLCLVCAMAVFFERIEFVLSLKHSTRAKFTYLIEELTTHSAWITLSVFVLSIALILTASRGGFGATCVGVVLLWITYSARRKFTRRHALMIAMIFIGVGIGMYAFVGRHLDQRATLEEFASSANVRAITYATTIDAIKSSPWRGTGFGTFADVFPAYADARFNPMLFWDKAHNVYLENALELGIPAALALNLIVVLLTMRAAIGIFKRRREKMLPMIGVAATVLVGLHSLVDFSLQMPAVSILYVFILGFAVSQSWSEKERSPSKTKTTRRSSGRAERGAADQVIKPLRLGV